MPPRFVLDLYDPKVGVEPALAREIEICLGFAHRPRPEAAHPPPIGLALHQACWRRAIEEHRAVEPIDANEDGAGSLIPALHDHDGNALGVTTAQIRPDPDLALDAHGNSGFRARAQCPAAVLVSSRPVTSLSSRNSSSVMRPVSASLRSR